MGGEVSEAFSASILRCALSWRSHLILGQCGSATGADAVRLENAESLSGLTFSPGGRTVNGKQSKTFGCCKREEIQIKKLKQLPHRYRTASSMNDATAPPRARSRQILERVCHSPRRPLTSKEIKVHKPDCTVRAGWPPHPSNTTHLYTVCGDTAFPRRRQQEYTNTASIHTDLSLIHI